MRREAGREILTLRRCPQCGYDLFGLPRRHRCPECAFEYDESMFALHAWRSEEFETPEGQWMLSRSRWRRLWAVGEMLGGAAMFGVLGWIAFSQASFGWMPVIVLVAALGAAWRAMGLRRARRDHGGTVCWLFSDRGVAERVESCPWHWLEWSSVRKMRFRKLGSEVWRIRLGEGMWGFYAYRGASRPVFGWQYFDSVVVLTQRDAAAVRREIRRRMCRATTGAGAGHGAGTDAAKVVDG